MYPRQMLANPSRNPWTGLITMITVVPAWPFLMTPGKKNSNASQRCLASLTVLGSMIYLIKICGRTYLLNKNIQKQKSTIYQDWIPCVLCWSFLFEDIDWHWFGTSYSIQGGLVNALLCLQSCMHRFASSLPCDCISLLLHTWSILAVWSFARRWWRKALFSASCILKSWCFKIRGCSIGKLDQGNLCFGTWKQMESILTSTYPNTVVWQDVTIDTMWVIQLPPLHNNLLICGKT